jgi:signal recognition particle receptor subunit beta
VGTLDRDARSIHGKIVYLGPAGAGKTANLELLSRKLKREHRGDLKVISGNGATWEHLPVTLGNVRGWETSLDIWAAPGAEASESVRSQLLQDADGVVFVADLRRERHETTLAAFEELLGHLAAQGRSLDEIALVIQYNHGDAADETAVEQLHRRLGLGSAVFFDAVATQGKGVLQTLSALSKQVLALLRSRDDAKAAKPAPRSAAPELELRTLEPLASYEDTALDASIELVATPLETGELVPRQWELSLPEPARAQSGTLVLPLRLHDAASGEQIELRLELRLAGSGD